MKKIIIGFGELLWDKHKTYELIGGAPGNFAYHTTQCGLDGYVVSAVGKDASGDRLLEEAKRHGLQCIVAQVEKPTSVVDINEDDINNPQYTIRTDVAWDYIPVTKELESWAQKADAVCFGTLAQRSIRTHETLQTFLSLMRSDALKIFDVNLRQQFYNREMIEESLGKSDILKLNEDEAGVLNEMFDYRLSDIVDVSRRLLSDFHQKIVILTCGGNCSYVFTPTEESYMKTPQCEVVNVVGAGDSFTAAFCSCIMQGKSIYDAHALAVRVAAYVCTQDGAMPQWPDELKTLFG